MLLDPVADKLLIAAAFITLVQFNPALVPAWMAVVVIGREFLVSGLRSIAASEGFTIQASELGKFKMLVQIISVVAVILARRWREWPVYGNFFLPVHWIAWTAIWFMVLLSLVSALDYFVAFWSRIDRKSEKRRRRSFVSPGGEKAMSRLSEKPAESPLAAKGLATRLRYRQNFSGAASDSAARRARRDPFFSGTPAFTGRAAFSTRLSEPRGVFTTLYLSTDETIFPRPPTRASPRASS